MKRFNQMAARLLGVRGYLIEGELITPVKTRVQQLITDEKYKNQFDRSMKRIKFLEWIEKRII